MDITVKCRIIRETDAAILIEVGEDLDEVWIPYSQVSKIVRNSKGPAEVSMTKWIAEKKGLV